MSATEDLGSIARKHALLNAVEHGGKANPNVVLGRIFAEMPSLRPNVKPLLAEINSIVAEVNNLSLKEQQDLVKRNWPESMIKEKPPKEEKQLPPLPRVKQYKQVVTRFSPNPDCVLHMGNARAMILSHDYAKLYHGKFILRFEDTDPRIKRPELSFYEQIREDLTWLDCGWDEEFIQSDRLEIYYDYAKKLIEKGHAYVCTCETEAFRKRTLEGMACPCRSLSPNENLLRWEKMLEGSYGEGEAIVRIKTDLKHPNPAVREWPALRIIDTKKHPHPRVGDQYRIWPLYNLSCGLDDHLMGVTHIIRGKEHLTNEVRQRFLYQYFGWLYPEPIHTGRLKVVDAVLSKSKIKLGMKEGIYKGYDDPRLATLTALRRRGISHSPSGS